MNSFTVAKQKEYENLSEFAEVKAPESLRALLERSFDVLAGRQDSNHFRQIVQKDLKGRNFFINDNCWWTYTDAQCNCLGTYGWRPFFGRDLREIDHYTWRQFFALQADGKITEYGSTRVVPPGAFSLNVYPLNEPEGPGSYYCNYFPKNPSTQHPDHDEEIDFQLLNLITTTDWLLFEHSAGVAGEVIPSIGLFLEYLNSRPKWKELPLVGVQGSQLEFGHGTKRYPASTAFYLLKFYQNLKEVYYLVSQIDKAKVIEEKVRILQKQIKENFLVQGKWFANARAEDRQHLLGNGQIDGSSSDYFEVWPNTAPALFSLFNRQQCQAIAKRFMQIPPLYENHLAIYNYPARPISEMDDNGIFPPAGAHVNGGWFWMISGPAMALLVRAGHPRAFSLVAEVFEDHDARYTIDAYNQWGKNKGEQWPDKSRPDMCSITNLGTFGNFLRALLGIQIGHDQLELSPVLPPELEEIQLKVPIYIAGKEVYLTIVNRDGELIKEAKLDGENLEVEEGDILSVPLNRLKKQSQVEILI